MKYALLLGLFAGPTLAQTSVPGSVRGHIQTSTGTNLFGISVGLEGTGLGAPTDEQGNFILKKVPAGTYTLVATGLGY